MSKYIDLGDYKKGWIFRHQDLPVTEEDRAQIKPLGEQAAGDIWCAQISAEAHQPTDLNERDWPCMSSTWVEEGQWQQAWEADTNDLPQDIAQFIDWQPDTLVYFCYDSANIIETRWAVFQRCWKNFLFFDDGPLLIGRKRQQAVQFFQDGSFKLGNRK